MGFFFVHDIVEENGKTIKENNLARQHAIPIGALVEVKFDKWHGDGACEKVHARLWVVKHTRDCDGTPMYTLSRWKSPEDAFAFMNFHTGFVDKSLTPIEITDRVREGYGALEWGEEKG